jgi:hypothetical protein
VTGPTNPRSGADADLPVYGRVVEDRTDDRSDDRSDERLTPHRGDTGPGPSEDQWTSIVPLGWASVLCGLVWLGGFGSFFAVGLGLIGILGRDNVRTDRSPPPGLRLCQLGLALGVLGLGVTAVWLLRTG